MTGTSIKKWREELGLNQKELSERLGVPEQEIVIWEDDEPSIPGNILELAMNWIEFQTLKPSREELDRTYQEIEETLQRTSKLLQGDAHLR